MVQTQWRTGEIVAPAEHIWFALPDCQGQAYFDVPGENWLFGTGMTITGPPRFFVRDVIIDQDVQVASRATTESTNQDESCSDLSVILPFGEHAAEVTGILPFPFPIPLPMRAALAE